MPRRPPMNRRGRRLAPASPSPAPVLRRPYARAFRSASAWILTGGARLLRLASAGWCWVRRADLALRRWLARFAARVHGSPPPAGPRNQRGAQGRRRADEAAAPLQEREPGVLVVGGDAALREEVPQEAASLTRQKAAPAVRHQEKPPQEPCDGSSKRGAAAEEEGQLPSSITAQGNSGANNHGSHDTSSSQEQPRQTDVYKEIVEAKGTGIQMEHLGKFSSDRPSTSAHPDYEDEGSRQDSEGKEDVQFRDMNAREEHAPTQPNDYSEVVHHQQQQIEDEDNSELVDDPEEEAHRTYWEKVLSCKKGFTLCLACHLEGHRTLIARKDEKIKIHCKSSHQKYGFDCKKNGCLARAKTKHDIGVHQYVCHGI